MASGRPILLVDNDQIFREALVEQLQSEGQFLVEQASSISQARGFLNESPRYDALILEVVLPDGDGCDFCASQRDSGRRTPVIILSELREEADVVRGLNAGANDYVTKPLRIAELLARLRAQIRIFESNENATFKIGPYTFCPAAKLLQETNGNRSIRLTAKEAKMLKFLYRLGDKLASRQVLLAEVWGYNASIQTNTLETHIYRLRRKIGSHPGGANLLISERGGYRLHRGDLAETWRDSPPIGPYNP
ncbi:response regulator transcription factor (plasmid) [Lichenicola cladoniae]|uniref:Response regulator transcription factor n=1 Tax=Lichenicola cladoniae TaxID=1484109 RepID=A0A6M8I0F5_9PROT|nr:response regulator transcription factor [Lichenicola cladoniae]NPD70379.1 response regulator transcription factor [Acetobacteraceae bacterium]QKE93805.1 response regulator transcription factor [Lichenicola cladoniae]